MHWNKYALLSLVSCMIHAVFIPATEAELVPVLPTAPSTAPSTPPAPDTSELTNALNTNVLAIGNLTVSNERVVGKLESTVNTLKASIGNLTDSNERVVNRLETTVDTLLESNDKNVNSIVKAADGIVGIQPSLNSMTQVARDMLQTWNDSAKESINKIEGLGKNVLDTWKSSMQPSVENIRKLGQDALVDVDKILDTWNYSMAPKVDDALYQMDRALDTVDESISKVDDIVSYVKMLVPLLLGIGSMWAALCCISSCMCFAAVSRASTRGISSMNSKMNTPFDWNGGKSRGHGFSKFEI